MSFEKIEQLHPILSVPYSDRLSNEETTFCDLLQKFDDGLLQRLCVSDKPKGIFHGVDQIDDFFVRFKSLRHNLRMRSVQNKSETLTI